MNRENNILLIEREHGEFDEVEFSFRYVNLNKKEYDHIQNVTTDIKKSVNQLEDSTYVLSIPLNLDIDPVLYRKINSDLNINESNFGVWISFTSEYDHSGFRLPNHVKDFYLKVGGQFDCSIINI